MNLPLDIIAAISISLAILLLYAGLIYRKNDRKRRERLDLFVSSHEQVLGERDASLRKMEPDLILAMNRRLRRGTFGERTQSELARAGLTITASEFILIRVASVLIGVFAGQLLSLFLPLRLTTELGFVLIIFLGFVGFIAPIIFLRIKQHKRLVTFEKQFPDALDVMQGSLRAGSSLLQAMELTSREMPPPLSEEFGRTVRDIGLGVSLEDALLELVDRVDSQDLDMFATAVNIQHRTGGNLAQIIEALGTTIRERLRVRGEIRVLTAQQRYSSYIISALPFAVGVALYAINQSYMIRLFEPDIRWLAMVAVTMMVLGFIALRRIASIEV